MKILENSSTGWNQTLREMNALLIIRGRSEYTTCITLSETSPWMHYLCNTKGRLWQAAVTRWRSEISEKWIARLNVNFPGGLTLHWLAATMGDAIKPLPSTTNVLYCLKYSACIYLHSLKGENLFSFNWPRGSSRPLPIARLSCTQFIQKLLTSQGK